jgi:hypothetical protein
VNGNPINTEATDGASNGYHWGPFKVVNFEEGPFYRVVPGVEHGDSGGPCFWPTSNGIVLAGLNSSTVGNWGQHPESSAIVAIADNAAAVRWIRSVTR